MLLLLLVVSQHYLLGIFISALQASSGRIQAQNERAPGPLATAQQSCVQFRACEPCQGGGRTYPYRHAVVRFLKLHNCL